MPIDNDPEGYFAVPSMLDDLTATDSDKDDIQEILEERSPGLECSTIGSEEIVPIDLRKLNSDMFSLIIGTLMNKFLVSDITLTDEEVRKLDAQGDKMTVLQCTCNASSGELRLQLLTAPKSEFRS